MQAYIIPMPHPLTSWPSRNRRLLAICSAVCALLLVWNFFFLSPLRRSYHQLRQSVQQKEAVLDREGWPKDAAALRQQLESAMFALDGDNAQNLPGLRKVTDDTLELATATFREQIAARFPDGIAAYINGVTRIDYKVLYDHVAGEFSKHGVTLDAEYFGLSDELKEPIWRMMFKLLTANELVTLAAKNRLTIASDGNAVARVKARTPVAYSLDGSPASRPYLMEFPVRLTVGGASADLLAFVRDLQSGARFLPVKLISLHSHPPAVPDGGGVFGVGSLRCTLTCSSFIRLPAAN